MRETVRENHRQSAHPCIQQDSPQQRLDVIICSSYDDRQFVSAVHVIYVGACQGQN